MEIRNYQQVANYLDGFIGKVPFKIYEEHRNFDPLERTRVFLNFLDNPQDKFKSVLVGGTSGKGSTAYLISHILTTVGYKTGLTISPHLQKITERIQLNDIPISDEEFVKLFNLVLPAIEKMEKTKIGPPSYFEILIAMAFLYFARQEIDIAVVEVGMGGEFDTTNTLNALIAVLTNVSLDHTNILGNTVEKIAKTKSGIIKNSKVIVVTGVKQPAVIKIVEEKCEKVDAKLYRLGKDFDGSIINSYKLSLLGDYQKENASLAVETVLKLQNFGFKVSEENIRKALSTAFFPGRFEMIKINPILRRASLAQDKTSSTLVLDGAHNPAKMKAFLTSFKKIFPKQNKVFLVGFKFDKDISKMLKEIAGEADEIIATEFKAKTDVAIHASADASMIKDKLLRMKYMGKVTVEKDSKKALEKALAVANLEKDSIVVVTGSLYLVGEVRSYLI